MSSTHKILTVSPRPLVGNISKKIRREGLLPAVVYGDGLSDSVSISLNYNEFEKAYRLAGNTTVIDLDLDGKKIHTLIHMVQYHPVRDTFLHIDFLSVNLKKVVEAEVPLVFEGVPAPVKLEGAILNKSLESITVSALPDAIPHEIVVDLSVITKNDDVIRAQDLVLPKGVLVLNPNDLIASVSYAAVESDESTTPETIVGTEATSEQK